MLEVDAKKKLCPFKMGDKNIPRAGRQCEGARCMAWQEWSDPVYEENTKVIVGSKVKDPAQGQCGMVPPELNCQL